MACGDRLAGVMHEDDGEVELPLQIAYARQQLRDLGGVVLIDRVQSDQRIEEQYSCGRSRRAVSYNRARSAA